MAKITKKFKLFGQWIIVEVDAEEENLNRNQNQRPPPPPVRTGGGQLLPAGAVVVAKKSLTDSDVSQAQGRLLFPSCPQLYEFLTAPERTMVVTPKQGMKITAMDNGKRRHRLNLQEWPSLGKVVLNKGWNDVVKANDLRAFDKIEVWCYRQGDNGELRCFVDVTERVERQQEGNLNVE